MARLNTARLILQATEAADRANFVRQDPAVVKAAKVAHEDVVRASKSTYALARETRSAWRRSETRTH